MESPRLEKQQVPHGSVCGQSLSMAVETTGGPSTRSGRRSQGATPTRSTRAATPAQQETPARRSTRAVANRLQPAKDAVSNPALPEIQVRQSYAYGSSKAPQLPEQLKAPLSFKLKDVTDRIDTAITESDRNLRDQIGQDEEAQSMLEKQAMLENQARAKELETLRLEHEQQQPREPDLPRRRTATKAATPVSQTTEAQKRQRTAAWAESIDSDQLEDISEEGSSAGSSAESRNTDPSSFPSGFFDHSYNYERGLRGPRAEPRPTIRPYLNKVAHQVRSIASAVALASRQAGQAAREWLWRFASNVWRTLFEVPDSAVVAVLVKSFVVVCLTGALSWILCFTYRNYLCDPTSTSGISATIQGLCGSCVASPYSSLNLGLTGTNDAQKLISALQKINARINVIESRQSVRDQTYHHLNDEMDSLRRQQTDLASLLENLASPHSISSSSVASPLIPKINFFSFPNGAQIMPNYTSPTLIKPSHSLPVRVLLRMALMAQRYKNVNNPAVALMPWQDVGDCWCASASSPGQDRIRLGVRTREMIYPTELVLEHAPRGGTLTPQSAPRDVELWADMNHLSARQWQELRLDDLRSSCQSSTCNSHQCSPGCENPGLGLGDGWVKLASGAYDYQRDSRHLQRFKLHVNQHNDELTLQADKFIFRARTTHGADHGCLYRVRLHGLPVTGVDQERKFDEEWYKDRGYDTSLDK